MRWDQRQLTAVDGAALPGLGRLAGLVRSVRTPEFEGVTFHEVLCRSALNHVPAASAVPFRWTINPYRGCSHACVYCLAGDTQILMADGATKPLAQVRLGDRVWGTVRRGGHRRYVRTEVLAHWSTAKPAFRVRLANGTTLVASADHRFLTGHGWKRVADLRHRRLERDHLLGPGVDGPPSAVRASDLDGPVGGDPRLRVLSVVPLDSPVPMFDITTGTGDFIANGVVSHNCFARGTHRYLDLDPGRDFDQQIVVKVNVAEVARRELGRSSWGREPVAMGTNTDPYQRAEGRYRLMPKIIAALAESGTPFSILTKGTLLRRDLALLREAARTVEVRISVSLGVLDERLHRTVEPGTPTPRARLDLITAIREAGFSCHVLAAPILPGLTDSESQLDRLVGTLAEAGATGVTAIPLHLRPGAREWYSQWLAAEHPELVERYRGLYRDGSYADRDYQTWIRERVAAAARTRGLAPAEARGGHRGAVKRAPSVAQPPRTVDQGELF